MAFWITLIRGMLAIGLGVGLLLIPDKSLPMLANFMGLYWLAGGAVSLRWGLAGGRARPLAVVAGAIGILAGLVMMARWLAVARGGVDIFVYGLGAIIILTGLMHIFGGFPTDKDRARRPGVPRKRTWTSVVLGIFEVILGLMLILVPLEQESPLLFAAAAIWALLGGIILIGEAVHLRRQRQQAGTEEQEGLPAEGAQDRRERGGAISKPAPTHTADTTNSIERESEP